MKSIMLIGLGRFGKHIAMKLRELNHQVMAVDHKEDYGLERPNIINSKAEEAEAVAAEE